MKRISFVIIILCLILASCESKSGQNSRYPRQLAEKVIIMQIGVYSANNGLWKYKVKRPKLGTVTFIYDVNLYALGDTIMYQFH